MEFLNKLKMKSILKNGLWFVLLAGLAALFLVFGIQDSNIATVIVGAVFLVIALVLLIPALTGKHQKQILEKARELAGDRYETVLNCAHQLYLESKSVDGMRINYGLMFWENGNERMLFDIREICWIYQLTTQHRVYGIIPAGKSFSVIVKTRDGRQMKLPARKKNVQQKIQHLLTQFPKAIAGYSKERENLYNQDPRRFAEAAAASRAKSAAKPQG